MDVSYPQEYNLIKTKELFVTLTKLLICKVLY